MGRWSFRPCGEFGPDGLKLHVLFARETSTVFSISRLPPVLTIKTENGGRGRISEIRGQLYSFRIG